MSNKAAANIALPTDKEVGVPNVSLSGGGGGNDSNNWNAGGTVGVGTKVWENGGASLGVGAAYGQSFGRSDGHSWQSKPDVGVGLGFRYKF